MNRVVVVLCVLLSAGCGGGPSPAAVGAPTVSPTVSASVSASVSAAPRWTPDPVPSFASPESAMRYLADAWNRLDLEALMHVTDPRARGELNAMHREATDLRLDHCSPNEGVGDYECYFTHDYPKGY